MHNINTSIDLSLCIHGIYINTCTVHVPFTILLFLSTIAEIIQSDILIIIFSY